ncbi:MAG TPA: AAA family ATPase, partial [bacterium]|nr:AAA family ATPase [bacterium]
MPEQLHIPRAKITPPRLAVPLLPRPRLHDAVRSGAERRLVVLSAEAGYGKTALLLSVLPALDLPTAWVTLDPADADLNLFAAAVAASVARVAPDVPALVDRLLTTGPNPSDVRALLLRLFDDAPPLVVILDDFHTVEHNPEVLDLVDALLAHLPAHLHIILATRTWPRLGSLPRLLV